MRMLIISVFVSILSLSACNQSKNETSAAAIEIANKYCARNFRPWFELGRTCKLEKKSGKAGANCDLLDQANEIVSKRFIDSQLRDCSPARLSEMKAILD